MRYEDIEVLLPVCRADEAGIELPAAAKRLKADAEASGWTTAAMYAKARLGDGEFRETVSIRMRRAGEPRWTAVWLRRDGGKWAFDCAVSSQFGKLGARDIVKHVKGEL